MSEPTTDSPGVIAWPPLLVAVTLGVGLLFQWLWPRHPFPVFPARILGELLALSGGLVLTWGVLTMRRAGTNIDPGQPALALVADGPFRYSRNPLYLGNLGIYLGITLLVNALWPLLLLVPLIMLLRWGVIHREERYLEAKFGTSYRSYCGRVRRWL